MPQGQRAHLHRVSPWAAAGLLVVAACGDLNLGVLPPNNQLFFPSSVLVDTRAPPGEAPKWLFVVNGNSDLNFNAGTVLAVNLDRFWDAWFDPTAEMVDPYCSSPQRCVQPTGADVDDQFPCRRNALFPQVVECHEAPFVDRSVHIGSNATTLAASTEDRGGEPGLRLWIPVRGDPSVTFIDVEGQWNEVPTFSCGQDPNAVDDNRCAGQHRLTHLRNDSQSFRLPREPFNIFISPDPDVRLAYVAHTAGGFLSLIDMDGLPGETRPAIVDEAQVFNFEGASARGPGGYGLAQRPCFQAGEGPLGAADPEANVPEITNACERPLIYGSLRFFPLLASFTASGLDLDASSSQFCATPEQIGQPGAVICEPQVRNVSLASSGGLDVSATLDSAAVLADMAFGDPRGDDLYVVQSNPGALLRINTALDVDNQPRNIPAAPPVELCDDPNSMVIFDDGVEFARFGVLF